MARIRIAASTIALALAAGAAGCGQRAAEVSSAPSQPVQVSIQVRNTLTQAVNVYVVQAGTETFVRQVAANTTENLPVRGIPQGSQVVLRAVTVDGKSQFDSQNPMPLTSTTTWKVP